MGLCSDSAQVEIIIQDTPSRLTLVMEINFIFRRYDNNGTELGKPLAVGNAPAGFDWNKTHKICVSVVGNTFQAYVDDALVLSAQDSNYTSGAAGVRTWDSTSVKFTGFSLTPPVD